jgi:hypothetical protein
MPRVCTVCTHDESHSINVDLVQRVSYRDIARRYGVSKDAAQRHAKEHIPRLLAEAYESLERGDAEDLARELAREKADVQRLKHKAEADDDIRTALLACDKALKALELQAKVEQLIQTQPQVNIALVEHPSYQKLEEVLFRALERHHEARWAVADALKELDDV